MRLPPASPIFVALLVALYLTVALNVAFFSGVVVAFSDTLAGPFIVSTALVVWAVHALLLLPFSGRLLIRPVAAVLILITAPAAYFAFAYNVHFDATMLRNVAQTNPAEAFELLSLRFIGFVIALGLLPAALVLRIPLREGGIQRPLLGRLLIGVALLVLAIACIAGFSGRYATLFREHKALRYQVLPAALIHAGFRYAAETLRRDAAMTPVATDARVAESDRDRELLILVVGETARGDHFSLSGYARQTNPLLAGEQVISFRDVEACGTSTAVSVPCMFSIYDASDYSDAKGRETETLLDALTHAGVHVLWRDNNSSSHSVAGRVPYEDFKDPARNPVCDEECRDEGMLAGLQQYIDGHPAGDIVIVLHQMGNHGPAYYKRYPPRFERFTPVCRTVQLAECSRDEIVNAYDNAILYTDYFLSQVIALLKQNTGKFEAAMLYLSDHGESLGENGLWLHGMPKAIAPGEQTRAASIFWFGDSFEPADAAAVRQRQGQVISHHNLFHTVLGMLEIETHDYDPRLDLRHPQAGAALSRPD